MTSPDSLSALVKTRVTESTKTALEQLAREDDRTVAELVRFALRDYVNRRLGQKEAQARA